MRLERSFGCCAANTPAEFVWRQCGGKPGVSPLFLFGMEMFTGDENESHNLDGDASEAEGGLGREGVKQSNGGNSDEKPGRHQEESREFHSIYQAILHSKAHQFSGTMQV